MDALFYTILILCLGVVAILVMGLGNFGRAGEDGARKSNKMMQYRIMAQAAAVGLIVIAILFERSGGN
ncbi:MAG: twin transmembrane helix small protein [Pseudomonadota bacterium]